MRADRFAASGSRDIRKGPLFVERDSGRFATTTGYGLSCLRDQTTGLSESTGPAVRPGAPERPEEPRPLRGGPSIGRSCGVVGCGPEWEAGVSAVLGRGDGADAASRAGRGG